MKIENCRGQTYDNASNMSGKYKGVQAEIKKKNKLAHYVPCAAHSLNIVGESSVDECVEATSFFGYLQKLYPGNNLMFYKNRKNVSRAIFIE